MEGALGCRISTFPMLLFVSIVRRRLWFRFSMISQISTLIVLVLVLAACLDLRPLTVNDMRYFDSKIPKSCCVYKRVRTRYNGAVHQSFASISGKTDSVCVATASAHDK